VFAGVGHALDSRTVFMICLGLFIGCAAKERAGTAHTWLPDAMEGPTPVSALIHAATMVTAGVYLIARFAPLWSRLGRCAASWPGSSARLDRGLGAVLGCVQWDIKRILAYAPMSQDRIHDHGRRGSARFLAAAVRRSIS